MSGKGEDEFPPGADNFPSLPPIVAFAPTPRPHSFAESPSTPDEGGRPPFLDLFPPLPDAREPPPGSLFGTAAGPAQPRVGTDRRSVPTPPSQVAASPGETVEPLLNEMFYGLHEKPFSLSTDPKFLYHSTAHDHTAQALLSSVGRRDGIVVITGPPGIGKTALCRAVLEELDRHTLTSFLVDPFLSVEDLLQTLLIDFGVLSRDDLASGAHPSPHDLRVTLQSFLASLSSLQASAVVLIDEAQNLPASVLDEIRALIAMGEGQRLLHVVLVGEPGLISLLKRKDLRPLTKQVAVRSELGPLLPDEIAGYIKHRLAVAGGGSSSIDFDDAALARIHELTGGVPRTVNLLCDRALARWYDASASVIDVTLVDAAADDLNLPAPVVKASATLRLALAGMALLLMLVGAGAALWVFRDDVRRTVAQWERVPAAPAPPRLPLSEPIHVPR
jgi:general secretion pathway protein A